MVNPHAKAPLGANVNLSGEPYSEHQHTLHIISLALLPRTRASQAAGTPGLNTQSSSLAFSVPVPQAQPQPSAAWRVELLSSSNKDQGQA